jgi:hypothetical protein
MTVLQSISRRSTAKSVFLLSICLIGAIVLLSGCQAVNNLLGSNTPSTGSTDTQNTKVMAEVTFNVQLPEKLADGQHLYIEILDEVTGLALNPARAQMQSSDQQTFTVKIPVELGSVIKYRYLRDNDPVGLEYTNQGKQVRYRLYSVEAPGVVTDYVSAWKTSQASANLGRIQGQVANKSNNAPIVNALVTAGGVETLSASDGSFILEGLPSGTHNLVVYSMDGSFKTFQQGAIVASDSTTPALVMVNPVKTVNVTFVVHPPEGHMNGVPIRLIGNTYGLGNTFADLAGGMSVIASRAPVMAVQQDGSYSLTLKLPAGLDLRYKYSLGDGFWNAERTSDGNIRVRQLIVPEKDIKIDDTIDTWKTNGFAPITYTVNVPSSTPASDIVSIQFNPFGWTQPIPMWSTGNNRWVYVLYNPLNAFSTASYRYCRNDQCGVADATETAGNDAKGIAFAPKDTEQTFNDTVNEWTWDTAAKDPVVISDTKIAAKDANTFQVGAEFMTGYQPSWQPYVGAALQNLKDIGSNSVILTPTWHLTHQVPPIMEPVPGRDPLWFDLTQTSTNAQQKGLSTILHPVLLYDEDPATWWTNATRNDGWWQSWFDRYHTYMLYNADLATQTGAKALIIGDDSLLPAIPGGKLSDGSSSNVPGDADKRWSTLIADIRARYSGKLVWFVSYNADLTQLPDFVKNMDVLYVQVAYPNVKVDEASQANFDAFMASILDGSISKIQQQNNQPVILSIQYPSVDGAYTGCVSSNDNCLSLKSFQQPAAGNTNLTLSMKDQSAVYSAALTAINQRSWVSGFFASGYYPVIGLKDLSTSTRGKPAGDVMWYWFPRLLGQVTQ